MARKTRTKAPMPEHAKLDAHTTESGPSRLHAPSKPHVVEAGKSRLHTPTKPPAVASGKSRLQTSALGRRSAGAMHSAAPTLPHVGAGVDTTEAGPPRLGQYRR
jgi:hypothetical protein